MMKPYRLVIVAFLAGCSQHLERGKDAFQAVCQLDAEKFIALHPAANVSDVNLIALCMRTHGFSLNPKNCGEGIVDKDTPVDLIYSIHSNQVQDPACYERTKE
jgi:hypothetical protein